jgi:hypothetical protein
VTHPNEQSFDLKEATRIQMAHRPIQWRFRHVLGHQDDHKSSDELDRHETLNCKMDTNAKAFREYLHTNQLPRCDGAIDGEPWPLRIHGEKICSNLANAIRQACLIPPALAYWSQKG